MREILFKAKRIDNGEWVEGSLLQTTAVSLKSFIVESSCYTFDKWDWNECVQVDTDTICQYTGLNDKNGNKIWENDVVRHTWTDGQDEAETDVVTVKYDNYGFTPFIWEYDCDGCCLYCETLEVEVIGNIFDNKDLIGE